MNVPVLILGVLVGGFGVALIVRGRAVGAKRPRTLRAAQTDRAQVQGWTLLILGIAIVVAGLLGTGQP